MDGFDASKMKKEVSFSGTGSEEVGLTRTETAACLSATRSSVDFRTDRFDSCARAVSDLIAERFNRYWALLL